MNITFRDIDKLLVNKVSQVFKNYPNIMCEYDYVFAGNLNFNAIISPTKCIDRMDGGIAPTMNWSPGPVSKHNTFLAFTAALKEIEKNS